jgi:hypothetical protein
MNTAVLLLLFKKKSGIFKEKYHQVKVVKAQVPVQWVNGIMLRSP